MPLTALLLGTYVIGSLLLFGLYGMDKAAARRGGRRIPESTLHIVALAGGWPGALLGQRVFRDKTQKQPFRTVFWATVVLNCAAAGWLLAAASMNP